MSIVALVKFFGEFTTETTSATLSKQKLTTKLPKKSRITDVHTKNISTYTRRREL